MLRLLALLLLLANLVFWAWSRGMLDDALGPLSKPEREPERYALQVHPEWVKVLPPKAASAALAWWLASADYRLAVAVRQSAREVVAKCKPMDGTLRNSSERVEAPPPSTFATARKISAAVAPVASSWPCMALSSSFFVAPGFR